MANIHYRIPVPILLGQPNTGKTFLSRIAAAIGGNLQKRALFNQISSARLGQLLGTSMLFFYNDPPKGAVIDDLITAVSISAWM